MLDFLDFFVVGPLYVLFGGIRSEKCLLLLLLNSRILGEMPI